MEVRIGDRIAEHMIEVRRYVDSEGRTPFVRWFQNVEPGARARVGVALDKILAGNLTALKGLGSGLFEIRLDYGPGYRIYCGRDGATLVILLGGGTKKRQQEDIAGARLLWRDYKARKDEQC
jgi:putative addiction module killer protein